MRSIWNLPHHGILFGKQLSAFLSQIGQMSQDQKPNHCQYNYFSSTDNYTTFSWSVFSLLVVKKKKKKTAQEMKPKNECALSCKAHITPSQLESPPFGRTRKPTLYWRGSTPIMGYEMACSSTALCWNSTAWWWQSNDLTRWSCVPHRIIPHSRRHTFERGA